MRDALGLNDPDALMDGESKRQARARAAASKTDLRAGECGCGLGVAHCFAKHGSSRGVLSAETDATRVRPRFRFAFHRRGRRSESSAAAFDKWALCLLSN